MAKRPLAAGPLDTAPESWHKTENLDERGGVRMRIAARLAMGLVATTMLLATGCVPMMLMGLGGAAGIGSYKWMEGTMEKDYPRPMQETYNAAVEAAKQLKLQITSQNYSPTESNIEAVTQDGTKVTVTLIARPNEITTVKIRFGMMGNADWSAYYHRQIMKILNIPDQP